MAQVDPAQAKRTNQILWLVLLASQAAYVGIVLVGTQVAEEPPDLPAIPLALAVVTVATGAGSHFCWRRATGAGRPLHSSPPEPAAAATFYILAWVLDESVAGLVLGLLAFAPAVWGPFSLVAFSLMLVHRPA
jgi:hypothetical protein